MSPADGPVIGEGGEPEGGAREIVEQLQEATREAMTIARDGVHAKEEELWARYRELTKERRERRKG